MTDPVHHHLGDGGLAVGALAARLIVDRVGHAFEVGALARLGGAAVVVEPHRDRFGVRTGAQAVAFQADTQPLALSFQVRAGITDRRRVRHLLGARALGDMTGHAGRQICRAQAQANAGTPQSGAQQRTPLGASLRYKCQNGTVLSSEGELAPQLFDAAITPAHAGSDRRQA